ncbi:MAG: response regulator transcription factor [Aureispira sp.]|nr:response regulator transcription factor [Aureispira sp.]
MNAIIIDDENKARRVLKALLEEYCPTVTVVAMAANVPDGVKAINQHQPDLVFLDIEMPQYNGFQLLEFFDKGDFGIVFTTAYSEYAIQAFRISAIDYLLKPIQISQLIDAVEKAAEQIKQPKKQNAQRLEALKTNLAPNNGSLGRIALPISNGLYFANMEDIIFLEADSSYTYVHLINESQKLIISKLLKDLEKLLPENKFVRIHRKYLINVDHIKQYLKSDGGYVIMANNHQLTISRHKRDNLLQAFENLYGG